MDSQIVTMKKHNVVLQPLVDVVGIFNFSTLKKRLNKHDINIILSKDRYYESFKYFKGEKANLEEGINYEGFNVKFSKEVKDISINIIKKHESN